MKILFLDIDGVLNGHDKLASGYCGIRQDCVERLNRILAASPDSQLVISSAWRYMMLRGDMTVKGFEYLLLVHGVRCHDRVFGHTAADGEVCDEPNHFDVEAWKQIGLKMRGDQIRRFVSEHSVSRFVVLDDLPLGIDNLVWTDGHFGMTDSDAARAIAILEATEEAAA